MCFSPRPIKAEQLYRPLDQTGWYHDWFQNRTQWSITSSPSNPPNSSTHDPNFLNYHDDWFFSYIICTLETPESQVVDSNSFPVSGTCKSLLSLQQNLHTSLLWLRCTLFVPVTHTSLPLWIYVAEKQYDNPGKRS